MSRPVYIHYGAAKFDPTIGFPIKNRSFRDKDGWFDLITKPRGGLWASCIDATYGWKQWNEDERFMDCDPSNAFKFVIKEGFTVKFLRSIDDIKELPLLNDQTLSIKHILSTYCIDFEKCLECGIDALELQWYGEEYEAFNKSDDNMHHALYGWDCDSIIILNSEAVEQIGDKR